MCLALEADVSIQAAQAVYKWLIGAALAIPYIHLREPLI